MYVYIQFGTEFFPTKQPLIPRLARKNKEVGLVTYRKAANFVRGLSVHASVPNDAVQSGSMPEIFPIPYRILIYRNITHERRKLYDTG